MQYFLYKMKTKSTRTEKNILFIQLRKNNIGRKIKKDEDDS